MYIPASFAMNDPDEIDAILAEYPFGILLTADKDGLPSVSHIPMLAERREGALIITGHIARANPQAGAIREGAPALAIFSGPHAYISPSWYEPPYPQVPTWNYIAVHLRGALRVSSNPRAILARLTTTFEAQFPTKWDFDRLDAQYVSMEMAGIIAFEFVVERIDAKAKLSQNHNERDISNAIAGLRESSDQIDRACASAMENARMSR